MEEGNLLRYGKQTLQQNKTTDQYQYTRLTRRLRVFLGPCYLQTSMGEG